MSRYAVGDLQGFMTPLTRLLAEVDFNPGQDELWLVGDLVNRGHDNAAIIRFLRTLPAAYAVLGNHDLHLLAIAHGVRSPRPSDTLDDVLQADDREVLLTWLQHLPLLHKDPEHRQVMTHAGIPPCWSVEQAAACAREVEAVLRDPDRSAEYFQHMYGNSPDRWSDTLTGPDRWRAITNYFTRMRFVGPDSVLDFENKDNAGQPPEGFASWYQARPEEDWQIIFGHWAALNGKTGRQDRVALDTGYGWGNWLTLCDLDSGDWHQVNPEGVYRVTRR